MRITANKLTIFISGGVLLALAVLVYHAAWPAKSSDYAAWAQLAGTVLAIAGAAYLSSRHAEDQARIEHAERLKAAYLLARAAGRPIVEIERWLRAGASPDDDQVAKDWERVRNYREAWPAWIEERYEGYLEALSRIDLKTLADGEFLDAILSIRSRLKWVKLVVGPKISNQQLDYSESLRLSLAARDVLYALADMRKRTDETLEAAGLPRVTPKEAPRFPPSAPSKHIKPEKHAKWDEALRRA